MGYFHKLFGNGTKTEKKEISSQDIVEVMIANAQMCLEEGKAETAFSIYRNIVQLEPNTTAQYNLGSLYAQGLGTEQIFWRVHTGFIRHLRTGIKKLRNFVQSVRWIICIKGWKIRYRGIFL